MSEQTQNEVLSQSTAPGEPANGTTQDGPPTTPVDPCVDCLPPSRKDERPFTGCGCGACDSESVEIICQSEGINARAKYDEDHQDAPGPEQYEKTRLEYGHARYVLFPALADLNTQLADDMHEIRCRIDNRDKVDWLELAWRRLRKRLRRCRPGGCCVDEYTFEPELDDCETDHLHAQIAKFDYQTSQADACFRRLVLEPVLLGKRVEDVQAEIKAIHLALHPGLAPATAPSQPATGPSTAPAAVGAGGPGGVAAPADGGAVGPGAPGAGGTGTTTGTGDGTGASNGGATPPVGGGSSTPAVPTDDFIRLYTMALVARDHLRTIWWGFSDTDAFTKCLCRAMKVSMAGHRALASLTGEVRVRQSRWEQRNACCRRLRGSSVEEVITGYVRCIDAGGDQGDEDDGGRADEDTVEIDVEVKDRGDKDSKEGYDQNEESGEGYGEEEDEEDDEDDEDDEDAKERRYEEPRRRPQPSGRSTAPRASRGYGGRTSERADAVRPPENTRPRRPR